MTTNTLPTSDPATSDPATSTAPTPEAGLATASPAAPAASTTLSILSLVFSIVSIPTGMGPLAVAGVVLGFVGHRREPAGRTLAVWGIVVGFVSLFWWLLLAVIGVAVAAPFALWGFAFAGL